MEKKALSFSRKGLLVRNSFARWLKRAIDRATWHEACRHGDEYRQRINSQSRDSSVFRSSSRSVSPLEKKQINGVVLSPHKKRTRKRISADYRRPRTDEDLAKRFKEVCVYPYNDLTLFSWFHIHRTCKSMSNVGLKGLYSKSSGTIYKASARQHHNFHGIYGCL